MVYMIVMFVVLLPGHTCLHLAAQNLHIDVMALLLNKGAKVNTQVGFKNVYQTNHNSLAIYVHVLHQ